MGMYEEIMSAINRDERATSQWKSPLENLAWQLPQMFAEGEKERRVLNRDRATNFMDLYEMVSNEESINNYSNQIQSFAEDVSGDKDLAPIVSSLQIAAQTKKEDFYKFKSSIDEASDFMSEESFADTQAEFLDLQNLAKKRGFVNKDGQGLTLEFIINEKSKINSMLDGMRLGVDAEKGATRFRYNKNANMTDIEAMRKLSEYGGRLDVAIQTLGEDGIITPAEAKHILIGDLKAYQEDKKLASAEAIENITEAQNDIDTLNTQLIKIKSGDVDFASALGVSDTSSAESIIKDELLKAEARLTKHNEKYKAWVGRNYYEEVKSPDKSGENLFKNLDDTKVDGSKKTTEVDGTSKKGELSPQEVLDQPGAIGSITTEKSKSNIELPTYKSYNVDLSPSGMFNKKAIRETLRDLGEDSVSSVFKGDKYLRQPKSVSNRTLNKSYHNYITNIKTEDANKDLDNILKNYNMDKNYVSKYISKNASRKLEKEFQEFLDKNNFKDRKSLDIFFNLNRSLYKEVKNPVGWAVGLMPKFAGGREPKYGSYHVGNMKPASPKNMKLSPYTIEDYENLKLLYNFIGQKKKQDEGGK